MRNTSKCGKSKGSSRNFKQLEGKSISQLELEDHKYNTKFDFFKNLVIPLMDKVKAQKPRMKTSTKFIETQSGKFWIKSCSNILICLEMALPLCHYTYHQKTS